MDIVPKTVLKKLKDGIQYRKSSSKGRSMKEAAPEFSYIVDANRIPASGQTVDLKADEKERAALARRFGLEKIEELFAHLVFKRVNQKRIRLDAVLKARVEQQCGITLKTFVQPVEESFSVVFLTEEGDSLRTNEIDLDMTEDDDVEILRDDKIDAGELVSEYLSLALDPFPHAPDAVFRDETDSENE